MTPQQREAALRLADDMNTPISVWADHVAHLLHELAAEPAQEPVAWVTPDELARMRQFKYYQHDMPLYAAPQQRHPLPEAAGFDHALGAGRFTVVKGAFWWHIRIGDSTNNVGKFHSKMAAENMALKLLTAFRDGAYTQYMISLSQQRKPLTDRQIDDIWIKRDCMEAISAGDLLAQVRCTVRAAERFYGIGETQ